MRPVGDALTLDMHNKYIAKHSGKIEYTMTRALACLEAWLPGNPLISRMSLFLKATREVQPRVPTTRCHLGLSGSDANLSGRFLSSFACSSQDLHPLGLFTYLIGPSMHHVALES